MQALQSIRQRAAVAVIGLSVVAALAVGALAAGHAAASDLAARKLGPVMLAGGGKPVRDPGEV